MSEKVLLEEGGSVSVHTRIKDMCKTARNRLGLTNQDICDRIDQRFGIEDFSINTVNNFFSERSKATTIYTTGYICAVLDISIDAVFGIEQKNVPAEDAEFIKQLAELKVTERLQEQQITHLENDIEEKNIRIVELKDAVEHYRREQEKNSRKVQPWVFTAVLVLFICTLVFFAAYLAHFDIGNPNYGIFTGRV